jgi:hypothetical protein
MEIIVVSGIVAGFIALSEGVKHACRSYIVKNRRDGGGEA